MGTHPIFESDFNCLTECLLLENLNFWTRLSLKQLPSRTLIVKKMIGKVRSKSGQTARERYSERNFTTRSLRKQNSRTTCKNSTKKIEEKTQTLCADRKDYFRNCRKFIS